MAAAVIARLLGRCKPLDQARVVMLLLALLCAVFAFVVPGFASFGNFAALLRSVSVLGMFALGMTVVVVARGIDLSQVALALVSAAICARLIAQGQATSVALLLGLFAAIMLGMFNGALVAYGRIPALFATLASALLTLGVARATWFESLFVDLPADRKGLLVLGQEVFGLPVSLFVLACCAALLHVFLDRTTPGRFIYAHGDNPDTAWLTGIPLRRLTLIEYALCAAIGYAGAILMLASTATVNLQVASSTLVFDVIMVVVLGGVSLAGGRGGVAGVLAATLLIGVLLNGMTLLDLGYQLQNIIKGLVLLAAIVLDRVLHPQDAWRETSA